MTTKTTTPDPFAARMGPIDPQTPPSRMNEAMRDAALGPRANRAAALHARRAAAVEEKLRRAYLGADPTATEADFQEALPQLREERRRRAAVDGGGA